MAVGSVDRRLSGVDALVLSLLGSVSLHSRGDAVSEGERVLLVLFLHALALGTTEEVRVFLLGEVDIVESVRVRVLLRHIAVVLVERIGAHVA